MANNLQYILRPDASTLQSRTNIAYKKLSSDFKSGLNRIAQTTSPKKKVNTQKTDYISRPSTRVESNVMPHGDWYKPSKSFVKKQEEIAANYEADQEFKSRLDQLYMEQKLQEEEENKLADVEELTPEQRAIKEQEEEIKLHQDYLDSEYGRIFGDNGASGVLGKATFILNQQIGLAVNQANEIDIQSTVGKIALAKKDADLARAWAETQNAMSRQKKNLELFSKLQKGEWAPQNFDQVYKKLAQQIYKDNAYLSDANNIEMAAAFKVRKMTENTSWYEQANKVVTRFTNAVGGDPYQYQQWEANYAKQLSDRFDKEYDNLNVAQKTNMANQVIREKRQEVRDYQAELDDQVKQAASRRKYWGVSKHAENLAQLTGEDGMFHAGYWMWNLPQQMGSSYSSPAAVIGQTISLGTTAASAAMVATGVGAPLAPIVYSAGQLAAAPFNYFGGMDENYAEVADKWASNFSQNLQKYGSGIDATLKSLQQQSIKRAIANGISEKDAKSMYDITSETGRNSVLKDYLTGMTKSNDPRLTKAKVGIAKGLQQQFEQDNIRTMGSEAIQTLVSLAAPGGAAKVATATKFANLGTTTVGKALSKTAAGRVVVKAVQKAGQAGLTAAEKTGKYVNKFKKSAFGAGFETGAEVGDVMGGGILSHAAGGVIGGTVSTAYNGIKTLAKEVMPENMRLAINNVGKVAIDKFTTLRKFLTPDKLVEFAAKHDRALETAKLLTKYGYKGLKANLIDRFSEGNEELAQYINSQDDFAKMYGYNSTDMATMLWNDFKVGGRIADFYASMIGLGNSPLIDDKEAISNWQGGFAMGGMHPTMLASMGKGVYSAYSQAKIRDVLLGSTIANRAADGINRASNEALVEQIVKGNYNQTAATLDLLQKEDDKRAPRDKEGTPGYWQQRKENLSSIYSLVNDPTFVSALKAKGILKGTREFNIAVADRVELQNQMKENAEQTMDVRQQLDNQYNKKWNQDQIDEQVKRINDQMSFEDSIKYAEQKTKAKNDYIDQKKKEFKEKENREPTEVELKNIEVDASKHAEDVTKDFGKNATTFRKQRISELHRGVNRLKALLEIKGQINSVEDLYNFAKDKFGVKVLRPDAKALSKNIDEQIKSIKQELGKHNEKFAKDMTDAETLDLLSEFSNAVGFNDQDIINLEKYAAILHADSNVLEQHNQSLYRDLVKKEDSDEYEYNPEEYSYRQKQVGLKIALGSKYKEDEKHERAKAADPGNSVYNKRIQAIMRANDNNAALNWLVADIWNGDVVSDVVEKDMQDQEKAEKTLADDIQKEIEAANHVNYSKEQIKPTGSTRVKSKEELNKEIQRNREEYQRKKQKTRDHYRKKRKARRGKMRASFLLGFDELAIQSFNGLIENAKIGFYKFEQFYNDIKGIMAQEGEPDSPRLMAIAKAMYIRHYLTSTKEQKANMNRPMDVQSFGAQVATHASQDITFDGYRKALKQQQDRALVSSFHASIAYDDYGKLHVFINPQEIDRLKNDPNYSEIRSNVIGKQQDDVIKYLLDNSDRFSNIDFTDIVSAIFKQDNSTELLQGLVYYLSSIDGNKPRSQSLYDSDIIRQAAQEIMLGKDYSESVQNFDGMTGVQETLQYIQSVRDRMLNNGEYKVLDTDIPVYGFDENGNGVQSQADIVLVGNDGQIMIIDVKNSYAPQMEQKMKSGTLAYHSDKTMMQKEQEHMRDINVALYDLFGSNVIGTFVFPFVIDRKNNYIHADRIFKIEEIDYSKPVTPYYNKSNEDISNEVVKPLQDKVNEAVEELNSILEQINDITGESNESQSYNIFKEGSNKAELLLQIKDLYSALEDIQSQKESASDRLEQLKSKKKYTDTSIDQYPEDYFNHDVMDDDYDAGLGQIYESCKKLDTLLSQITDLKVTTPEERAKINELIYAVYEVQGALDQFYGSEQFNSDLVSSEQKLIAAAINKLVSNNLIYGDAATKATQWWSTQFASNVGNATYTYFNKIKSYLNTFDDDFMNSLVGNRDLQRFWSGIFNNQFQFIVNGAENAKSGNPTLDSALQDTVYDAQIFIQQFNQRFPVDPNETENFDPNSVESINNIDDQWRELYSDTTKHFPAFRAMLDPHYFSIALDINLIYPGENGKSGSAELVLRGNDVQLKLTDSKGRSIYMTFDQGQDQGPRGIDQKYFARKKAADARFVQKVKYMLQYIQSHPGYHISLTLSRSKGSIENGATLQPVTKFLFGGIFNQHDLYSITCDKNNRIGFLKSTMNVNTGDVTKMVYGGPQLNNPINGFDLEYVKRTSITQSGNMVYFYDTGELEKTVQNRCIGVPLVSPRFTPGIGGQANKIADLLWYRINQGQTMYQGYSIDDLLKQVLYIKDDNKVLNEKFNSIEGMVTLDPANKQVFIGNITYTLNTQQDYTNLYNALCDMYITKDSKFVQQNMSDYIQNSGNSVLSDLKSKFIQDSSLQKVELPNGLTFEREDFMHDNGKGTTGLGYLLRNGYLMSAASKLNPPVVYVDNVQLVQDAPKTDSETISKTVQKQTIEEEQKKAQDSFLDFFHYEISEEEFENVKRNETPSFADAVKAWVDKTVGVTSEWIDQEKLSEAPYKSGNVVLAECLANGIRMSNSVPYTIGFHEAFHRALELLVEPSVRDAMYKAYRDHNGNLPEREVAEGLADLFVDYMKGTKDARELGKQGWIKTTLKKFSTRLYMMLKYRGDYNTIAKMFETTRSGKLRSNTVTQQAIQRYYEKFNGSLHYEINGRKFDNIATASDKEHMARALAYIIVNSTKDSSAIYDAVNNSSDLPIKYIPMKIINNLTGEPGSVKPVLNGQYMTINGVTHTQQAFREVFYAELNDKGEVVFPNFQAVAKEVKKYLTEIMDAYDGKYQHDEDIEDSESKENDYGKSIERYDRSSFEFNKLDSVSKPVKFFFATIPFYKFDDNGKLTLDLSKNKYGVPTFMPIQQVYNVLVSKLHDVKNPEDLMKRLQQLSTQSPMYKAVYDKFERLYNSIYKYDSEGELRSIDYDKESMMVQIFSAIKGHEHNFIIGRSLRNKNGGIEVKISTSNYDRDAVAYPRLWNSFLTSGQTGVIKKSVDKNGMLSLNDVYYANGKQMKMPTTVKSNVFTLTANYFQDLVTGLQNEEANIIKINGFDVNVATNSDIEVVKDRICERLRMIGITFNKDILDNMLSNKYGGVGKEALTKWLNEGGKTSILSFINELSKAVQTNGVINKQSIDNIFKTGFVSELGNAAGAYLKLTTDKMSNGMDGTKLYNESQNNSITNTVENLNSNDKDNAVIKTILQYSYNLSTENNAPIGSIVAKMLYNNSNVNIGVSTPIGFRTDNRGDTGSKYSNLAEAEDYINKFAMTQAGYCIFPTLADKGTYMVLNGIPIPGMQFGVNSQGQYTVNDAPTIEYMFDNGWRPGMPIEDMFYLRPSNRVLDQFIEYAKTEYQAILDCREQLGMHVDNPKGLPLLKDEDKIVNYHVDKKGRQAKGGITFHSLTTLRVPNGKGGITRFSMKEMSPDEQIKTMKGQFFSKSLEEQRTIMALTLQEQTDNEVAKALSLGIISKEEKGSNYNGLNNICLNQSQIDAVEKKIFEQIKQKLPIASGVALNVQLAQKAAHSLAIMSILQDATNRSIISSEECTRLFIGNPGFFKNVEDIQKRIGGLVSTGDDNVTTLQNFDGTTNEYYTCAEVADYEVGSQAEIMSSLKEKMRDGELREIYGNYFGFSKVDDLPIESVRQQLVDEIGEDRVKKIEDRANDFYEAYTDEINVADGASYITADMCKRMLRARGAYNNDVAKAFDILQGENAYSWQDKKDAFKLIYEKTNLVTTKYTAYGFRDHTTNGNKASNLAVPYYNKFALFPIFECLATGKLKGIYDKMKNEGVDNLLMTSAVKVGLQGHVNFNGETIDKPFNKYTQRLAALRRQLNTDPEEGDVVAAGTQMIKVCLSSLRLDRKYGDLTGKQVLDKLMGSINKLSKIGAQKFKDKFYTDGNIDQKKLSKYLIEQLGTRNANKNLIDALTINPETGQMNAPIAATSDASWMESMLISAANKDIINIMTPGSSFIQRSVFGIEGKSGEGAIKGQDIYNGKRLQMINEEGSMDSVISIDYFQDILPKNLSFNEARQWLIDHEIIGDKAKANTIGYRIPTQAQSSIHALRFVDVVPAVKSTVILPTEFTKITGSDKLYQCSNQYNIKNRVNCWKLHIKWTISSQAL